MDTTKSNEILVSIHCITYNQKDYIRQCLDGFVMQKTNFKFVAYVGDDCSTDGTTEIVKEYEKKYPNIIKGIYQSQNTKATKNYFDVANACKSKYVALCEGDDYWIDENKLQKQVDFLESHPDYTICFHPAKVVYEDFEFKKPSGIFPPRHTIRILKKQATLSYLLRDEFIATSSVMYRWQFNDKSLQEGYPNDIVSGDWFLDIFHAKQGKIKILPDIMSVYRRNPGGVWSDSIANEDRLFLKYGIQMINLYDHIYKNFTDLSQEYLHTMLLPNVKAVADIYYRNGKFKKLEEIKEKYPEYINMALSDKKLQIGKFEKKYKKYKNLFRVTFGIAVALSIALIIFITK